MTESNNNKGNPYHDESGKFTSKENQGTGEPVSDLYKNLMETFKNKFSEKEPITDKDFSQREFDDDVESTVSHLQLVMEEMGLDENAMPSTDEIVEAMPKFYKELPDLKERVELSLDRIKTRNENKRRFEERRKQFKERLAKKYPEIYNNELNENEEDINFDDFEEADKTINIDTSATIETDSGEYEIDLSNYSDGLGVELYEFLKNDKNTVGKMTNSEKKMLLENDLIPNRLQEDFENLQESFTEYLRNKYIRDIVDDIEYSQWPIG